LIVREKNMMRNAQIVRMLEKACATELQAAENRFGNPIWHDGLRAEEVQGSLRRL